MADYAALKKGGFMRQKQKDNFSLRIRVVGGHLDAKQLAKVAEVSEKYGEGYVHLTSRQGVEIPFIKLSQIDEVKAALEEGDVVPVCADREFVPSQPVRVQPSVQADVSILTHWHRNWMRDTLDVSFLTNLNLVLPDARTTA